VLVLPPILIPKISSNRIVLREPGLIIGFINGARAGIEVEIEDEETTVGGFGNKSLNPVTLFLSSI